MKRAYGVLLAGVLLFALPEAARAQSASYDSSVVDTIRTWSKASFSFTGLGYEYGEEKGDVGLTAGDIKKIVQFNPEAYAEVSQYGKYEVPAFIGAVASVGVLGWGIGSGDNTMIYAGLGGLVVSFIVDQIGENHLERGIRIFNRAQHARIDERTN